MADQPDPIAITKAQGGRFLRLLEKLAEQSKEVERR